MTMTALETRMYNTLRKNPIPMTKGQFKAALNRLAAKGLTTRTRNGWCLSMRSKIYSA